MIVIAAEIAIATNRYYTLCNGNDTTVVDMASEIAIAIAIIAIAST